MLPPELRPVDLDKCTPSTKSGAGFSNHPEIVEGRQYLARIQGRFVSGFFHRAWYGWFFTGYGQLDKPGTNSSGWEGLWEVVDPNPPYVAPLKPAPKHEDCWDCDAYADMHREGNPHCLCGEDWPCPEANNEGEPR